MAGQFPLGHRVGALLQLQHLEVHALALVGDYEERVNGTLGVASGVSEIIRVQT